MIRGRRGKFDVGGFGTSQGTTAVAPLTGVRFEDDGLVDHRDRSARPT
jgi:hypothetical protein